MNEIVVAAAREALLKREYLSELAASVSRIPLSRQQFVEWGTETLYDHLDRGGVILTGEGEPIDIYPGIFDDAHGDDASGVWVSELRKRPVPRRRPRKTLLLRLQLYDVCFRLAGRPVQVEERRSEVHEMRTVLRNLSRTGRARYVNEARKLRKHYSGERVVHYGAAMRRLRLRFADEMVAWNAQR